MNNMNNNNRGNSSPTINNNNTSLSDSGHAESEILQCNLLTHGEIQNCILQANAEYKHECHAIELINNDLNRDSSVQLINLLKSSLPKDEKLNIVELNSYLYHLELKKHKNVTFFFK